ncbi:MAG TPA: 50S ribosomal protein L25 [Acidimicrobiales bacterium]|nr:50S ribosomal protein L25 [Acidimicrobiales bacterium]
MPEITLAAEVGRPLGSRNTRRLRREGKIPGVIYGHGTEPLPVAVVGRDLRTALSGDSGLNTLLSLEAAGKTYLTLAREIQHHPVKGTVNHVDFVIVRRDEIIAAEVPISLIGEAIEVQRGDGLVDQQLFNLSVRAIPANVPSSIEVDVSELVIGGAVRVADLPLPEGVTTELDGESIVVIGQPPRVVVEEAAEGEAAEGEAAEGGEAPAESAAGADQPASEG